MTDGELHQARELELGRAHMVRVGRVWENVRQAALGGLAESVAERCAVDASAMLVPRTPAARRALACFVRSCQGRGWSVAQLSAVLDRDRSGLLRLLQREGV